MRAAKREQMTRDRANIRRQTVPEPELDGEAIANAVNRGFQLAAGEMNGAVDRSTGRGPASGNTR